MAEGFDFENPVYDDDYDFDEDKIQDVIEDEPKLPDVPVGGLSDVQELKIEIEKFEIANLAKQKADIFFDRIEKEYGLIPSKKKL